MGISNTAVEHWFQIMLATVRFWRRVFLTIMFVPALLTEAVHGPYFEGIDSATIAQDAFFFYCLPFIVLSPFIALAMITFEAFSPNPIFRSNWEIPTRDSNPLTFFGGPFPALQLMGQMMIVLGAAYLAASVWSGWSSLLLGVMGLLAGLGWLFGIKCGIRLFSKRFRSPDARKIGWVKLLEI